MNVGTGGFGHTQLPGEPRSEVLSKSFPSCSLYLLSGDSDTAAPLQGGCRRTPQLTWRSSLEGRSTHTMTCLLVRGKGRHQKGSTTASLFCLCQDPFWLQGFSLVPKGLQP